MDTKGIYAQDVSYLVRQEAKMLSPELATQRGSKLGSLVGLSVHSRLDGLASLDHNGNFRIW